MRLTFNRRGLIAAMALAACTAATAQSWPSKPVTLVVPFAPGGSTDVTGRMLAAKLKAMNLEHVMVIADQVDENLFLAARNLANVLVVEPRYADPLSLVFYKKVVVTKGAIDKLQEMFA